MSKPKPPGGGVRARRDALLDRGALVAGVVTAGVVTVVAAVLLAVAIVVASWPLLGVWAAPYVRSRRYVGRHMPRTRQKVVIGESTAPLPAWRDSGVSYRRTVR